MMSTGSQDNISNEQRQKIDNEGFISSLSPLPQPPSPSPSHACRHHGEASEHRSLEWDLAKSFLTLTLEFSEASIGSG